MPEIGVVVTKAVRIDRDGARSLLAAYRDWVNATILSDGDVVRIGDQSVDAFLKRYANLGPGENE